MPIIQNRLSRFTILYLPKRHLRFKAKEQREVYKYELESEEFKERESDFLIIEINDEDETAEDETVSNEEN